MYDIVNCSHDTTYLCHGSIVRCRDCHMIMVPEPGDPGYIDLHISSAEEDALLQWNSTEDKESTAGHMIIYGEEFAEYEPCVCLEGNLSMREHELAEMIERLQKMHLRLGFHKLKYYKG